MSDHIVLMGDSSIDNDSYVADGEPDVTQHVANMLPQDWAVTRVAYDGATTMGLRWQFKDIPEDATQLVVSVGGNNALRSSDLLRLHITPPRQKKKGEKIPFFVIAMRLLHERIAVFEKEYSEAMDEVLGLGLPTAVCTIYTPEYGSLTDVTKMALTAFNDVIVRYAMSRELDIIDLRDLLDEDEFVNSIEPGVGGGWKIAAQILDVLDVPLKDPEEVLVSAG